MYTYLFSFFTSVFQLFLGPGDICTKMITITNPLLAPLLFSVSTEGPFLIKANGPLSGHSIDDISTKKSSNDTYKFIDKNTNQIKNQKTNQNQNQNQNKDLRNICSFGDENNLMSSSAPFPDIGLDSGIKVQGPFEGPSSSVGRVFNLLPKVRSERGGKREKKIYREKEKERGRKRERWNREKERENDKEKERKRAVTILIISINVVHCYYCCIVVPFIFLSFFSSSLFYFFLRFSSFLSFFLSFLFDFLSFFFSFLSLSLTFYLPFFPFSLIFYFYFLLSFLFL